MAIGTRGTVMQMQKKARGHGATLFRTNAGFGKGTDRGAVHGEIRPQQSRVMPTIAKNRSGRQRVFTKKNEMSRGRPEADQVSATATQSWGGIYFASVVFFTIVCGEMNSIEL